MNEGLFLVAVRIFTRRTRKVAGLVVAAAVLFSVAAAVAQPGAFQAGCEAYAAGRFEQALASFQKAVATEPSSGAWHNLGNAQWQCGQPGPAVLSWERALWISPFQANPRANLRFARKVGQLSAPELSWWEVCSTWLPVNVWAWIAAASFWSALALVLLPTLFRWRKADWHQAVAATGFAVFLLTIPALVGVQTRASLGVVLGKDTPLRLTPTAEAQTLTRLAAGEMARVESRRGHYLYIRTSGDAAGWIERGQFALVAADSPEERSVPTKPQAEKRSRHRIPGPDAKIPRPLSALPRAASCWSIPPGRIGYWPMPR